MKITTITVQAGRTFNHPYESYSNLRPEVTLTAAIDPDEDPTAAARQLQAQAERLVEDHKNALLRSLEEIEHLRQAEREVANLEEKIGAMQRSLDRARRYLEERRQDGAGVLPAAEPAVEPEDDDPL